MKVARKLLVVDTETGGLDPNRHAILSLAAVVYHDGAVEDSMEWLIYDSTGESEREATLLNGITPDRAHAEGKTPWYVTQALTQMLLRNEMYGKVTLAGHNLAFDIGFLKRLYNLANVSFAEQFNHGGLCTKSGALLLEQAGRLSLVSSSLSDVVHAVGAVPWGAPHGALNDAMTTARVLKKIVERLT